MKTLLVILVLGCSGCVSFPVFDSRLSRDEVKHDKSVSLPYKIAVRSPIGSGHESDEAVSIANAVTDLRRTGLFLDVYEWAPERKPDLIVYVQTVCGVARCGTPFMMYPFTLGLVSVESRYKQIYEFTFVSPSTGKRLSFERKYGGSLYMPSILLIPFTFYKRCPTGVDLLRHDLVGVAMGLTYLTFHGNHPVKADRELDPVLSTRGVVRHVVEKGQDLQEIGGLYGVDAETLKRFNGIKGDALRVGQEVKIPEPK